MGARPPAGPGGHDTIYEWRCRGGAAAVVRTRFKVDRRGFIAEFCKRADP